MTLDERVSPAARKALLGSAVGYAMDGFDLPVPAGTVDGFAVPGFDLLAHPVMIQQRLPR